MLQNLHALLMLPIAMFGQGNMITSSAFNARRHLVYLGVLTCLFLTNFFSSPCCYGQRFGPYDGKQDEQVQDLDPRASLRSIYDSKNNVLNYNTVKKDPEANRKDGKDDDIVTIVWKVVRDLVGSLIGALWDLARDFVRPIVQSLIEHMLTLLHNPNVASNLTVTVLSRENKKIQVERTMKLPGGAEVPYDLVDTATKKSVRQGFEFTRAIAINLLLLLFLIAIWKYWTEAAWRNGHNLMGAVGRLIATTALILGWPIVSFYLVEISNEMIDYMFKSIDYASLDTAVTRIVGLGFVGSAMALFTGVASTVIGTLGGPWGVFAAGFGGALSGVIYFLFLGITIYETVYLIVLKAVQTILMLAQFMFAPIFLMFFALPDTERIASTFIKSCIEVSLWTFFWAGMLRLLVIVMDPDGKSVWGQGIMLLGVLQLMIQVPAFMAHAQISPVSDFISPRGAMSGVASIFTGAAELAKTAAGIYKRRTPDNKHSQPDAVKTPSFNRGADDLADGRSGNGPPPKFGNPQDQPSNKSPDEIGRMDGKELAGLMQRHKLNHAQSQAAKARLAELSRTGTLNAGALSEQEFAALAPLMSDGDFANALAGGGFSAGHLAALANAPLSPEKRAALKHAINNLSPASLAALNAKQLAAVGPFLDAKDELADALAADPDGTNKLGALLPTLNDASFDRLLQNDAIKRMLGSLTPRQLGRLSNSQLAKVANHLPESKLMDPATLAALRPEQLSAMNGAYDRLTPDQKKTLVGRLSGAQVGALAPILASAFNADELADLPSEKLAALGDNLSDTQLREVASKERFDDAKLAALAPMVKDPNKLQALAAGLRANPKVNDFKPETLAQMFGALNGEQIGALAPALALNEAKVKAIAGKLKTPEQISRFAAAIEDDAELSNTLINELSLEGCASLPKASTAHMTAKELNDMNPLLLAAIGPKLSPGQTASLSDEKLAQVAALLSPDARNALIDNMPALSRSQRAILAPPKPARSNSDHKAVSLRGAIDNIAQGIDDEDVYVGDSPSDGFHASFDKRGKLYIQVPAGTSRQDRAAFIAQAGLAMMVLHNPGAREACAEDYEANRGLTDPSIHSGDPADQPRIMAGIWKQAMIGARAYLSRGAGNQFTDFLTENSDPLTDEMHASEIQRMTDPTAADNPFRKSYFYAKDLLERGGIENNATNIARVLAFRGGGFNEQTVQSPKALSAVSDYLNQPGSALGYAALAARVLPPEELTPQRITWIQRFMQDGNSINRIQSVVDVDMIGEIYGNGGSLTGDVLGRGGTIANVHRAEQELQRGHSPTYAGGGRPVGTPGPRLVAGQATYLYTMDEKLSFEPSYEQFRQPDDVPVMSAARMREVIPIYLQAGLTHEQLAIPDVAFSIRAIEADNPEMHRKLAQGIRLCGAAPGVSPGLALVVDQAERHGHTKLTQEILIATEHKMRQRQMASTAGTSSDAVPTREQVMQYLEHPDSDRAPLKSY
jgi:hypothetical protein